MNRKFHRWYDDLRFGQKILVINTITAGAAMLLLTLSIAVIYIFSQRNQMLEQTSIQSQVFGESLAASLSFNDADSARGVRPLCAIRLTLSMPMCLICKASILPSIEKTIAGRQNCHRPNSC